MKKQITAGSQCLFPVFCVFCHADTQIRRYVDRCYCLPAIDAFLLTKIDFLLSRMLTKIDFCGAIGHDGDRINGGSSGRIDGGSSGRRVAETPAVAAEEKGQQ